jgi:hypothetical protein
MDTTSSSPPLGSLLYQLQAKGAEARATMAALLGLLAAKEVRDNL